jgi:hypothetical protein
MGLILRVGPAPPFHPAGSAPDPTCFISLEWDSRMMNDLCSYCIQSLFHPWLSCSTDFPLRILLKWLGRSLIQLAVFLTLPEKTKVALYSAVCKCFPAKTQQTTCFAWVSSQKHSSSSDGPKISSMGMPRSDFHMQLGKLYLSTHEISVKFALWFGIQVLFKSRSS